MLPELLQCLTQPWSPALQLPTGSCSPSLPQHLLLWVQLPQHLVHQPWPQLLLQRRQARQLPQQGYHVLLVLPLRRQGVASSESRRRQAATTVLAAPGVEPRQQAATPANSEGGT